MVSTVNTRATDTAAAATTAEPAAPAHDEQSVKESGGQAMDTRQKISSDALRFSHLFSLL